MLTPQQVTPNYISRARLHVPLRRSSHSQEKLVSLCWYASLRMVYQNFPRAREQETWVPAVRKQPHHGIGGFLSASLGYDSALSGGMSLQLLVSYGGYTLFYHFRYGRVRWLGMLHPRIPRNRTKLIFSCAA